MNRRKNKILSNFLYYLKYLLGLLLGYGRGAQYKFINGDCWVKEHGKQWEQLSEHLRREHPDEYHKHYK